MTKTPILPKLILTDIDGVWTDGGMYYDNDGAEWKRFNTADSAGVLFCRLLGISMGIITGEDTQIVARRAAKLKVEHLHMGVKNKVLVAKDLCRELGIDLSEVAYIGDDINDILLHREVGFSAAPSNAPDYVKKEVDLVLDVAGGDGAFRAFVEHILQANGKLQTALDRYLDAI